MTGLPLGALQRVGLPALLLGALLVGPVSAAPAAAEATACRVLSDHEGLQPLPGCQLHGDRLVLDKAALATLPYDQHGLAAVYAGDGYHYVRANGRHLPVITFDNGPDYVAEGLVRGRVGTRIGYFDTQFRQAFPATFDFGWAFEDGVARVCNGCRPGTPDDHGHTAMVGGTWHRIDRAGKPAYGLDTD